MSAVPRRQEEEIVEMFRGRLAHDYEWLLRLYRQHGGSAVPRHLREDLRNVGSWSTDMRYSPRTIPVNDAKEFLDSAQKIIQWADERL